MENWQERTEMLLGEESARKLRDAHAADAITCGFDEAEALAARCGFTELWQFDGKGFSPVPF